MKGEDYMDGGMDDRERRVQDWMDAGVGGGREKGGGPDGCGSGMRERERGRSQMDA